MGLWPEMELTWYRNPLTDSLKWAYRPVILKLPADRSLNLVRIEVGIVRIENVLPGSGFICQCFEIGQHPKRIVKNVAKNVMGMMINPIVTFRRMLLTPSLTLIRFETTHFLRSILTRGENRRRASIALKSTATQCNWASRIVVFEIPWLWDGIHG